MSNRARVAVGAAGVAGILWGVWLVLARPGVTRPVSAALWAVGGSVAHDALLAPAVFVIGWLSARFVPAGGRTPLRAGLLVALCLVLVAAPSVLHPDDGGNPTLKPQDTGRNLALLLTTVAVLSVAGAGAGILRGRGSASKGEESAAT